MARKPKASEPVGVDEIIDTVKRALLSLQGRPVSLDDTIQALSLVSFELKQATLTRPDSQRPIPISAGRRQVQGVEDGLGEPPPGRLHSHGNVTPAAAQ
jgi:hypothetical protein